MAYLLIHLCRPGGLPWGPNNSDKRVFRLKTELPLSQICQGVPEHLQRILIYARELDFSEAPVYKKIIQCLMQAGELLLGENGTFQNDGIFDWTVLATLVTKYPNYYKDLLKKYYNNNGGNL